MSPELQQIVDAITAQGFTVDASPRGTLCVSDYDGRLVSGFTATSDWRNVLAVMQGCGLILDPRHGVVASTRDPA